MLRVIDLNSETTLPVDRVPDLETALDDPIQFLTLPAEVEQELDAFLSRPVSFSRVKGVIRDIHAEKDMPEWILDILTGIIEKFQIPELEDDDKVKRFTEVTPQASLETPLFVSILEVASELKKTLFKILISLLCTF